MEEIKIVSRAVISDKAYRLEEITFTKPGLDGAGHEQNNEIYFRPDAVSVLLVDRHKQVFILARQLTEGCRCYCAGWPRRISLV
jgi:GDP-mannose pyrophosphatase NudK